MEKLIERVINKIEEYKLEYKLDDTQVANSIGIEQIKLTSILNSVLKPTAEDLIKLMSCLEIKIKVPAKITKLDQLVASKLKDYRLCHKLTRIEAGELLGVSERTVYRIETNEGTLKLETIQQILNLTDTKLVFSNE